MSDHEPTTSATDGAPNPAALAPGGAATPSAALSDSPAVAPTSAPHPTPLTAIVEAILFVADGPVALGAVARAAECPEAEVDAAVRELEAAWSAGGRALRLQRAGDTVQAVTAPELTPWVERFLGVGAPVRLSPAALETLAIIAYRQPVTRGAVEAIRGVSADRAIATLLSRGLIAEVGRLETAGRPVQFGTTTEFLQHFGLAGLDELPPFERLGDLLERELAAAPPTE